MEKKIHQGQHHADNIKSSLNSLIDARVNLEREVVDFIHTSIADATDENNRMSVFGVISATLKAETRMLNKLKRTIEKDREPEHD